MMKSPFTASISTYCLAFVLLSATPLVAEEQPSLSESLIVHGHVLMERDNVSQALLEFSRALLIDQDNLKAKKSLISLSTHPLISADRKTQILRFEDLQSSIELLNEKRKYFEFKRDELFKALSEQGVDPVLVRKFKDEDFGDAPSNIPEDTTDPLAALNGQLMRKKDLLSRRVDKLKEQFQDVRDLLHRQRSTQGRSSSKRRYHRVSQRRFYTPDGKRIYSQDPSYDEVRQDTQTGLSAIISADDMRVFKNEIQNLYASIDEMRSQMSRKDRRIEEMKEDIVSLTLKLAENEASLSERSEKISDEVVELRSRFELSQRIIQEKEEEIASLKLEMERIDEKYAAQTQDLKVAVFAKDEKARRYKELLSQYEQKLSEATETIAAKDARLQSIKNDLGQLKSQFETLHAALRKSNQEKLSVLNTNKEYKLLLLANDRELNHMNKMVNEYRETLKVLSTELKEKDRTIIELGEEINKLRNEMQQMSMFNRDEAGPQNVL